MLSKVPEQPHEGNTCSRALATSDHVMGTVTHTSHSVRFGCCAVAEWRDFGEQAEGRQEKCSPAAPAGHVQAGHTACGTSPIVLPGSIRLATPH